MLNPDPAQRGGLLVARRDGAVAHLSPDYLARHPPDEHDPERLREDARGLLTRRLGEHGPAPTATTVGRSGEAHTRSLAWIGGQWDQVQHTHGHPRYQALLAERVEVPPLARSLGYLSSGFCQ